VSADRTIAYILGTFPQPSQTFITREVRGLKQLGLDLEVYALGNRPPDVLDPIDRQWYRQVSFVPRALAPQVLAANAHYLGPSPGRYLRACGTLVKLPHRPRILALRALVLFMRAAWIARAIERAGGCRHIHAHFALAQTEVAMAVSQLLGVPYSFTAHARDIYASPSALEDKIRGAALVVTCTQYNADHLRALVPDVPASRVRLVHHGVDVQMPSAVRSDAGERNEPPLILAAGRLIEKKGFDTLIDACAALQRKHVPFRCRIVGTGPLHGSLRRRAAAAGLGEAIDFPGWMASADLMAQMQQAALFAMPSRISGKGDRDGIPNVVLEAMAAGLPVIATNVSGIPEAVIDDRTGRLVPPDDVEALARALEELLADAMLRGRFGAASRDRIAQEFTLAVSSHRLAAVFDAVSRQRLTNDQRPSAAE
jgi:glycosyltransferase involved in cell wall biosynthesis